MATVTTTTPAVRAQELETWMQQTVCPRSHTNVRLIGEYLVHDDDLEHVRSAANRYNDSAWNAALEAAEKSSCFFLKYHEVVSWSARLNSKVASNGHIRCDEVLLKGIRFQDQDQRPVPEIRVGSHPFYLASNRRKWSLLLTMCYYPLDQATTKTHFWVTQAGKTYSVTIRVFCSKDTNRSVFSIDARNTVQTTKRVMLGVVERFFHIATPPNPLDNSLVVIPSDGDAESTMLVLQDPNGPVNKTSAKSNSHRLFPNFSALFDQRRPHNQAPNSGILLVSISPKITSEATFKHNPQTDLSDRDLLLDPLETQKT